MEWRGLGRQPQKLSSFLSQYLARINFLGSYVNRSKGEQHYKTLLLSPALSFCIKEAKIVSSIRLFKGVCGITGTGAGA